MTLRGLKEITIQKWGVKMKALLKLNTACVGDIKRRRGGGSETTEESRLGALALKGGGGRLTTTTGK